MPDTPIPPPPPESWIPGDRYFVQLALGQVHGVLHRAVSDAYVWIRGPQDDAPVLLRVEDLEAAYLEACRQLGIVQAALNTGEYDRSLADRGFSGAQLKAKLKGFWDAVRRYAGATRTSARGYLSRMEGALGWCGTIVGSVSTALQKEIEKIPGAGAAAEGLKEFIELLQNAAESSKGTDSSPSTSAEGSDRQKRKPAPDED